MYICVYYMYICVYYMYICVYYTINYKDQNIIYKKFEWLKFDIYNYFFIDEESDKYLLN